MENDKEKFKKEFQEKLFEFSKNIIKLAEYLKIKKKPYSLYNQLIRAATSIGANIFEAKSSSSKRDFIKYFDIALKSANETSYWLALIKKCYPKTKNKIEKLENSCDEISKIITSSLLTLKNKK